MDTLVVYSAYPTNRLKYVLDWLLKERLHINYRITNDEQETTHLSGFIAYGKHLPNSISIPSAALINDKGVKQLEPAVGAWNGLPTLFAVTDSEFTLPFDLFSAIFYLLSRYEEYYPYKPDKHGRYPAIESVLYKKGWLQRPLADEWVMALGKQLQNLQGINIDLPVFLFQPTYDIDIAYSHLHKGAIRIAGAYFRALVKGDVKQISERTQVLKYKQKDPFDSFRWLRQLHKEYDCKPLYFVLSATKTTRFDKNIHPQHPAMIRVIKNLTKDGTIGIHPSYYSEQGNTLAKEKSVLEHIVGYTTQISRQHYIKIKAPDSYLLLIKNGITEDYSMGYGTHLGFRAGTGNSFSWFDLENDTITPLRIHPFCFMDTTAHYELKLSAHDAFAKLNEMSKRLEHTGSNLVTIFHNFSLGTSNEWKGWRQGYENFVHEKCRSFDS